MNMNMNMNVDHKLSFRKHEISCVRLIGTLSDIEEAAKAWRRRTRKRVIVDFRGDRWTPIVASLRRGGILSIHREQGTLAAVTADQLAANDMPLAAAMSATGETWAVRYHALYDTLRIGCATIRLDDAVRGLAAFDRGLRTLCHVSGSQAAVRNGESMAIGDNRIDPASIPTLRRVIAMALEVKKLYRPN